MRFVFVAAALATAFALGCGRSKPAAPELLGTWKAVEMTVAGNAIPAEQVAAAGLFYDFRASDFTIRSAGRPDKLGDYSVDATATPKRVVFTGQATFRGVYEVAGDSLKICLNTDESAPDASPTEFAGTASPKRTLIVFRRDPPSSAATAAVAATSASTASASPSGTNASPASPEGTVPPEKRRTAWRFVDAPYIFPDQTTNAGVFLKKGKDFWIDERVNAPSQDWNLVEETPEYVELCRPHRGFFVRLYNDHSTYRYGHETEYKMMFKGNWE